MLILFLSRVNPVGSALPPLLLVAAPLLFVAFLDDLDDGL